MSKGPSPNARPRAQAAGEVTAEVGIERSNSPARGLLTMFLAGKIHRADVISLIDNAQEHPAVIETGLNLSHLHFGAKASFDGINMPYWTELLHYFLREGFWCTLELQSYHLSLIAKEGLCRQSRFIPLVRIPLVRPLELGHNATLEIEDSASAPSSNAWSFSVPALLQQRAALPTLPAVPPIVIHNG